MPPVIVGGGLAGAAAATLLARAGTAPLLLERTNAPHDKICGEFLSGEAVAALAALGLDVRALGAVPITRVEFRAGTRSAAVRLPFPALSLSRRVLDWALLGVAERAGVSVQRGQRVRGLYELDGPVLLATGKHDLHALPRSPGRDEIGLKQYFTLPRTSQALAASLASTVRVVFFDGGYAGLQPVENGRLNLCLLVNGAQYRQLGGWPALLDRLCREPGLAPLADAQPLLDRPLAISRVPYGHLARPTGDTVWRLGDQAAVIPSFCGDGMAIALESGRLAAAMLAEGASADAYQAALLARTRRPVRVAMAGLALARSPLGRLAGMAGLSAVPGALGLLARLTRVADPGRLAPA